MAAAMAVAAAMLAVDADIVAADVAAAAVFASVMPPAAAVVDTQAVAVMPARNENLEPSASVHQNARSTALR